MSSTRPAFTCSAFRRTLRKNSSNSVISSRSRSRCCPTSTRRPWRAYGAYGEKLLYGKLVEGVIRSTFVIDVDDKGAGTVAVAQYNVRRPVTSTS